MSVKAKVIKKLGVLLILVGILGSSSGGVFASRGNTISQETQVRANPTRQKVRVDGREVSFRAYNIEGNNYFMLRDLAHVFKNTKSQFHVAWNQRKFAINLEVGKTYSGPGLDFQMKTPHIKELGNRSRAKIYKDGKEVSLLAYTIKDSTYFKLRDLGKEMDFLVDWDSKNEEVVILSDTKKIMSKLEEKPEPRPELRPEPKAELRPEPVEVETEKNNSSTVERQKQEMREEMLVLINEARAKEGSSPLTLNNRLIEMAEFKAQDMKKLGTLSHEGSYGSFQDLLSLYNIKYSTSGENILVGGRSVEEMFNMWWNSPGHKASMMNPRYRQIGIGFEDTKSVSTKSSNTIASYWAVQHFTD